MNVNNKISILENIARELKTNTFTTDAVMTVKRHPTFPKTVSLYTKKDGRLTKIILSDNEDTTEVFGANGVELQTCIRCTIAVMLGKQPDNKDQWFVEKYFSDPDRR